MKCRFMKCLAFKDIQDVMLWIIVSATLMVVIASVYDQIMGVQACLMCWLQRVVLILLTALSSLGILLSSRVWLPRLIIGVLVIGQVLNLRHLYVILFPTKVSGCMPIELFMNLSWFQWVQQILNWLSTLGRECSEVSDGITYVLVAGLLAYYSIVMYFMHQTYCQKR